MPIERLPYPVDQALAVLKDVRHLILVGAKAPVAFFAYPDKPSVLTPDGCQIHRLATIAEDSIGALEALAEAVGTKKSGAVVQQPSRPALPRSARSCPRAPSSPTSRSPPAAGSSRPPRARRPTTG